MKCILCNRNTNRILTDTLRGGMKGKVYLCLQCDLAFLKDIHKDIKEYYAEEYRKSPLHKQVDNPEELFSLYSPFQKDRIGLIKKYLNRNTILLEVGCSVGMFLYHIKPLVEKAIGIDYDSPAIKFARKKCKCSIFDVDIENTNIQEKSIDVMCIFQTLEHIVDPIAFLKRYLKYLRLGGIIYIEVPNLHDAMISLYNLPNHYKFYFHPEHLWYFSEKSIMSLMDKMGCNGLVEFIQSYNLFNHIHWLQNDAPQKSCTLGLSEIKIPEVKYTSGLNYFFNETDHFYKKLLSDLKATDNLHYIGVKNFDV